MKKTFGREDIPADASPQDIARMMASAIKDENCELPPALARLTKIDQHGEESFAEFVAKIEAPNAPKEE